MMMMMMSSSFLGWGMNPYYNGHGHVHAHGHGHGHGHGVMLEHRRRGLGFKWKLPLTSAGLPVLSQRQNQDLPPVVPKRKKKPFLRPLRRGGHNRYKPKVVTQKKLRPPANGLLVPLLVPLAYHLMAQRKILIDGIIQLLGAVPAKACRYCSEVYIGPGGHGIKTCTGMNSSARYGRHDWINANINDLFPPMEVFHLSDRLGPPVRHEDRFDVETLPAIVELCIQAGVDIPEYPTKRRTIPIQKVGQKIIDFDDLVQDKTQGEAEEEVVESKEEEEEEEEEEESGAVKYEDVINDFGLIHVDPSTLPCNVNSTLDLEELAKIAERTLEAWESVRSAAERLMSRYSVRACGYCPELHVGCKGHKVQLCGAFKHQWRNGQHGWQEASIDDLIPPIYVWHVRDPNGPPLRNELKRYYGKAPAIVELCLQGGASIPEKYVSLLRLDVIVPDINEGLKAA